MYDEYVKKIQKIARIKRFFHRYRFLFSTVIILGLVTTTGLVSAKGVVTDAIKVTSTYVYGDEIVFKSSAFLSDVDYEFADVDSQQWSNIKPYLVGEYKMRSKGANSFNDYYYGNEQTFTIVPKKISFTANEEEIKYGTSPTIDINDQLRFGDQLSNDYSFTYQDIETSFWKVMPNFDSLMILSVNGDNVTYCYELEPIEKSIEITQRSLGISTRSKGKIYDGTALKEETYSITSGSLVEGDEIELTSSTSRTQVGKEANLLGFKIQNQDGIDMTKHYRLIFNLGEIEISKIPISFSSRSFTHVYDGLEHAFELNDLSLTSNTKPLFSHQVKYTILKDKPFVRAGQYQNVFKVEIYEGEIDVSHNYQITYDFGTTTILQRALNVSAPSLEKIYDKEEVHLRDFIIDPATSLATKDRLEVTATQKYTDSGDYVLSQSYRIIDQITNEDFTDSYTINATNGSVIIQKIKLPLDIIKESYTYDGKLHSNLFSADESLLARGDEIVVLNNQYEKYVGEYDNESLMIDIIDESGLSNLKNYDIEISGREKALTITKRPLDVEILSKNSIYDAQPIQASFSEDEPLYQVKDGNLAEGDYIDISHLNNPSDVGRYPISAEFKIYQQVGQNRNINVDLDVTCNYEIDLTVGDFVIDKRELVITTQDSEQVYNRTLEIPVDEVLFKVEEFNLVEGHQIDNLHVTFEGKNVGTHPYLIDETSLLIVDEAGVDVTVNYAPIFVNTGKRTIIAREYEIKMLEDSQVYDGKPFLSSKHETEGLLEDDWITITGLSKVTHVFEGEIENPTDNYEVRVFTKDNEEVTTNYELSVLEKNIIYITPRKMSLRSESITKIFDGKFVGDSDVIITSGSLAEGDDLTISNLASEKVKHVTDSCTNDFEWMITNQEGVDVRENYDITIDYGSIEVKPFEITVEFEENNYVYNGLSHYFNYGIELSTDSLGMYIIDGAVPEGYHLNAYLWSSYPMLYAGEYGKPTYWLSHSADEGDFYTTDYIIHIHEPKELVVNRRPITVQSVGGSKIYDREVFDQSCMISSGDLAEGDYIVYGAVDGLVNIGSNMDNPIGEITIYNQSGNNVTSSYEISKLYGKVTIYERIY